MEPIDHNEAWSTLCETINKLTKLIGNNRRYSHITSACQEFYECYKAGPEEANDSSVSIAAENTNDQETVVSEQGEQDPSTSVEDGHGKVNGTSNDSSVEHDPDNTPVPDEDSSDTTARKDEQEEGEKQDENEKEEKVEDSKTEEISSEQKADTEESASQVQESQNLEPQEKPQESDTQSPSTDNNNDGKQGTSNTDGAEEETSTKERKRLSTLRLQDHTNKLASLAMEAYYAAAESGVRKFIELVLRSIFSLLKKRILAGSDDGSAKESDASNDNMGDKDDVNDTLGQRENGSPEQSPLLRALETVHRASENQDAEAASLSCLICASTTTPKRCLEGWELIKAVRSALNIACFSRKDSIRSAAKTYLVFLITMATRRSNRFADIAKKGLPSKGASVQLVTPDVMECLQTLAQLVTEDNPDAQMMRSAIEFTSVSIQEIPSELSNNSSQGILSQTAKASRRDVLTVFKNLCKISEKDSEGEEATRRKLLSLELLKIVIERGFLFYEKEERPNNSIKKHLCQSVLKNSTSNHPEIFRLSCDLFYLLVTHFRSFLKNDLGVFFQTMILRCIEPSTCSEVPLENRLIALDCILKIFKDAYILVDIFFNFDCDMNFPNIYERLLSALEKCSQRTEDGELLDSKNRSGLQENTSALHLFRTTSLSCLVTIAESLGNWVDLFTRGAHKPNLTGSNKTEPSTDKDSFPDLQDDSVIGAEASPRRSSVIDDAEKTRTMKTIFAKGVEIFNQKAKKGVRFLIQQGALEKDPEEVANFLHTNTDLAKVEIGEYLGDADEFNLQVMDGYVQMFDFTDMMFPRAIRAFLDSFRLPGEAQKIDRIMEKFAGRYCQCNPPSDKSPFASAEVAYVMAYSIIMLNTDAHNPGVKKKMTQEEFIKNNRRLSDDGQDLPDDYLKYIYDDIVQNEIKMSDNSAEVDTVKDKTGLDVILTALNPRMVRKREQEELEQIAFKKAEALYSRTSKGASAFRSANEAGMEIAGPMMNTAWPCLFAAFSNVLGATEDEEFVHLCLRGFQASVHVLCIMGMDKERNIFISSLSKFAFLMSVDEMRQKNVEAVRALINIALTNGNQLQESWAQIFKCISRYEHLHLLSSGCLTDTTMVEGERDRRSRDGNDHRSAAANGDKSKGGIRRLGRRNSGKSRKGTPHDIEGPQVSVANLLNEDARDAIRWVISQITREDMNAVFEHSVELDGDAIVDFMKMLCLVSREELATPEDPRIFSLQKTLEVAYHNLDRIRLVWSRIWRVLEDHFVKVCSHPILSVAMYGVDTLRQLVIKFLEKDEHTTHNFQKDFLRPFGVVFNETELFQIRELVMRCVSQVALAKVGKIKSGWRSMFKIFEEAAKDSNTEVVQIAFSTIEKIVREHFEQINGAEAQAFTDCIDCLVAYTTQTLNDHVSLQAIAFLRYCALQIGEDKVSSSSVPSQRQRLEDQSENTAVPPDAKAAETNTGPLKPLEKRLSSTGEPHNFALSQAEKERFFWYPLLESLARVTLDTKADISSTAMEVMFDILDFHGLIFTYNLWERTVHNVLFQFTDHITTKLEVEHQANELSISQALLPDLPAVLEITNGVAPKNLESQRDWMIYSCTATLESTARLFIKYFDTIKSLLPEFLKILTSLAEGRHSGLRGVSVRTVEKLIQNVGKDFSHDLWDHSINSLIRSLRSAKPKMDFVLALSKPNQDGGQEGDPQGSLEGNQSNAIVDARISMRFLSIVFESSCRVIEENINLIPMEQLKVTMDEMKTSVFPISRFLYPNADAGEGSDHKLVGFQTVEAVLIEEEAQSVISFLKILGSLPGNSTCDPEIIQRAEGIFSDLYPEVLSTFLSQSLQLDPSRALSPASLRITDARVKVIVALLRTFEESRTKYLSSELDKVFPSLTSLIEVNHPSIAKAIASLLKERCKVVVRD